MAQNLAYLPAVVDPGTYSSNVPYEYVYGYNGTDISTALAQPNYTTYGVLYNWTATMNGSATCNGTCTSGDGLCDGTGDQQACSNPVQGICPDGWHVPSHYEWAELGNSINSTNVFPYDVTTTGNIGTNEGTKLKSTGLWKSPNCCDAACDGGGICNTSVSMLFLVEAHGQDHSSTSQPTVFGGVLQKLLPLCHPGILA